MRERRSSAGFTTNVMAQRPPGGSAQAAEEIPHGHPGRTVRLKVSLQPHPERHATVGATWCSAVNATESTADDSTVSALEVCRWIEAIDSPSWEMQNEMDSPGRAESGQQYPSIGRAGDTPTQMVPFSG